MKNIITICILFCLLSIQTFATNFTWIGTTSNWLTAGNWDQGSVPTSADNVIITSAVASPQLQGNVTVTNFTISGDTLDLHGNTLTVNGTGSFATGTITSTAGNALLVLRGTTMTFTSGILDVEIDAVVSTLKFNGSTFNKKGYFEANSTTPGTSNGGSVFSDSITIYRSNAGSGNMQLGNSSGNRYDSYVKLKNAGSGTLTTTVTGASKFNGNIQVETSAGSGINMGSVNGSDTLASGKTITVGSNGFSTGTLTLRNFIQLGSTGQSFTLTSSASLSCINAVFNGTVSLTAPIVLLKESTFNAASTFTATGSTHFGQAGGNIFNSTATFTNNGTSDYWRLATTTTNTFNDDATFNGTNGGIRPNRAIFKKNVTLNGYMEILTDNAPLEFQGSAAQTLTGDNSSYWIWGLTINKTSGSVTPSKPIRIAEEFVLTKGNLVTTSTNLLTIDNGATVTGGSDSSFVDGPVKKTGNTSFIFPVGKNSRCRPIEISAPSVNTNAYTAEYFDGGQTLGNTMDGTIKYIRDCGYWNLARNSGTSNVTVKLSWDSTTCGLLDSATVKVANFNGSIWKDLGNAGITGNRYTGKVANSTTVITWGNFALAYNKCFITANAGSDQSFCTGDSVTIGSSPVATTGMTPYTYSWSPSGGLSSTSAANPKANPSSTTNYVVSVTDLSGCTVRDTATVTYHPMTITWTGATSSAWETASNWSPAQVPLYCDNILVAGGTNNLTLGSGYEVTNFTITSGTINLGSNYLSVSGKAFFNGGTINNGEVSVINNDTASFNGTQFGASVNVTADKIFLNGSQFDSGTEFIQTGSNNTISSGGNTFNVNLSMINSGTGSMYLANTSADTFNGDVQFAFPSTGKIYPAYTKNATIGGNLQATYDSLNVPTLMRFGANGGKVLFNGANEQEISVSFLPHLIIGGATQATLGSGSDNPDTLIVFKNFEINKESSVNLNLPVSITDSLIFKKGTIVSDTTSLLVMKASSVVTGASDSSFVDGAVKKFGNSAFVFPTGNYIHYRPLSISAPSSSTDAFLAQYFDNGQIASDSLDTTLTEVSPCNYWLFLQKNGSSNVSVSLAWDTSYCSPFDTTNMRLAFWNDTIWKDKGHGTFSGTLVSGKMISASVVSSYGYLALGTNKTPPGCAGAHTYVWNNTNSTVIGTINFLPGQNLLIQGTFTVNGSYAINNCQNIDMAPDAKILITSNSSLYIGGSKFAPCGNYQWDNIKIQDHTASLTVILSTFIGADTAIWSHDGGVYTVARSQINRCYKGIMVDTYGTHAGTIHSSWIGCATQPGGTVTTKLFNPHSTIRTIKGIDIIDVSSITFGTSSGSLDNNFFNMDNGIYATGTTFTVNNCNFDKMNNSGYGIYTTSTSSNGITMYSCNFTNCSNGVYSRSMDANLAHSYFNYVNNGIRVINCQAKTIDINFNEIHRFIKGIRVAVCANATVNILANNFNFDPVANKWLPVDLTHYGISAIEVMNYASQFVNLRVQGNFITNTRNGIWGQNVNANSLNQYFISDNHVYYQISYDDMLNLLAAPHQHYGIRLYNCNYGQISFNSFVRPFELTTPHYTTNGDEWKFIYGIQSSTSTNVSILRNDFRFTSSGVNFRDVCSGSTVSCHDVFGLAQFYECYRGVDLGEIDNSGSGTFAIATIPNQGPGDFSNCWFATTGTNANSNRVAGKTTPHINWYAVATSGSCYAFNAFNSSFGTVTDQPAGGYILCPDFTLTFQRENLIGSIVHDTLLYSNFPNERRYMQLLYAFRELDEDTAVRLHMDSNDSIYIAFYNNYKNTNIGKFRRLLKLIDAENYSDAADSLATITDTNTIETYRKTVLDIYLNIIEPGRSMDAGDSSDLATIANDCAIVGGPAVYEARAILEIEKKDSCIDAGDERLTAANSFQKPKLKIEDYLKLVPNPASDYVNVFYKIDTDDAVLKISDITGKEIMNLNLPANEKSVRINTSGLQPGLYLYSLNSYNQNIKVSKLIIK